MLSYNQLAAADPASAHESVDNGFARLLSSRPLGAYHVAIRERIVIVRIRHRFSLWSRRRKMVVGIAATILLVGVCLAALVTLPVWRVHENRGIETSPQQFTNAWKHWNDRSFSRYRMIASYAGTYPGIGSGCRQEVEVHQDQVVAVIENNCIETWSMTVDGIFELFQPVIGTGSSRAGASDGCNYYIVDAKYHDELGYPVFLENRLIGTEERYRYVYRQTESACLAILPPLYTIEIESLIPLD